MNTWPLPPEPESFTYAAYARCLELARREGYEAVGYHQVDELLSADTGRWWLLRHDIDYLPEDALHLARLEAEQGVRATYFFQTSSPFYQFGGQFTQSVIAEVLHLGHWLALHFDATQIYRDADVLDAVDEAAGLLERRFGMAIPAVSFHMPTHRPVRHLVLRQGRLNTYCPAFFEQVAYVSDSNQHWRGRDLAQALTRERPVRLQALIHPEWWRAKHTPMLDVLRDVARRCRLDLEKDILTPEQRQRLAA